MMPLKKSKGITEVRRHCEGVMSVLNSIAIHPIVLKIFYEKRKCQPEGGVGRRVRGSLKSVVFIIWGPGPSQQLFEIFQSGPK